MWIKEKQNRPSKLLLLLGEYFSFAILCGFVSILFFRWAANVIIGNYELKTENIVTLRAEYWMARVIWMAGIVIAFFVLILLIQKKFSYMIEISHALEEMEAGNLTRRITVIGDDELTDLAAGINFLVETVEKEIERSEQERQERSEDVASLSHDIRTPLTAVMGYLQLMKDTPSDIAKLHSYVEKAYDKAYRMKEMTDSLFENCVKDIEEVKPLEKVEGMYFLKQVFFDIQDFLEESGFAVEIEPLTEHVPFFVKIHREKVARVFDNLISNIEKYADRNHPVRIRARIEGGHLILEQENTVLDAYQKSSVESHRIGLRGVKKIVSDMRGSVEADEAQNTFRIQIRLPLV